MLAPVMQRPSSDAKRSTSAIILKVADSFQSPHSKRRFALRFHLRQIRHTRSMTPGAIAFTRMPRGPRIASQFLTLDRQRGDVLQIVF
jgi:hypothetical protein